MNEFLLKHSTKLIVAASVVLIGLLIMVGFQQARLTKATEERMLAEIEVAKAEAIADAKQEALESITKVTEEQIKNANNLIAQMQQQVLNSQRREAQAINSRNQIIADRQNAISHVEDQPDSDLIIQATTNVSALYDGVSVNIRQQSGNEYIIDRPALIVFNKALIETASRRESEAKTEQIAEERARQIDRLESIIENDEKKFAAMETRMSGFEDRLTAALDERDKYSDLAEKYKKELDATNRANFWGTWKGRAIETGVIYLILKAIG